MDKKELRNDPIRDRIITSLSYVEDNKNSVYIFVGLIVAVILIGSYLSTTQKELELNSSHTFGKILNNSIANNVGDSVTELASLIESADNSTSASAYIYLLDYYMKNNDYAKLDSMLNMDFKVDDDVLSSKVFIVRGDMSFNNEEYEEAISYYSLASENYPSIDSDMKFKKAVSYYNLGNLEMTKSILDGLLSNDDLAFDVKNKCEKYMAMLENNQ